MMTSLFADQNATFWMPPAASTFAEGVDKTYNLILGINYLYGIPIYIILFYFLWRFRRTPNKDSEPSPHHSFLLEVTWTVIPTIMVVGIFFQGFIAYIGMTTMPANPYEIQVGAKKWAWNFTYPNGFQTNELHIPDGRPVLLTMRSEDVMHSLYIPAFRVKMDVIPGRYTQMWFEALPIESAEADATSIYDLFCTEYCGTSHSAMLAKVHVHKAGQFDTWLAKASNRLKFMTPCQAGELLWERKGCKQCHSIDGKAGTGPTWQGTYGTQQEMTSGETVSVDPNYIRESILNPNAKVRKTFRGVMPSYQGQLSDEEIDYIVAYIKYLNPDAEGWTDCVRRTDDEIKALQDAAEAAEKAGETGDSSAAETDASASEN